MGNFERLSVLVIVVIIVLIVVIALVQLTEGNEATTPTTDVKETSLVNAPDGNGGSDDVYLRDLVSGTTTLVSHASSSLTTSGNGDSDSPVISADGNWVAFRSSSNNLAAPDTNFNSDIFVWSRATGTISLISVCIL